MSEIAILGYAVEKAQGTPTLLLVAGVPVVRPKYEIDVDITLRSSGRVGLGPQSFLNADGLPDYFDVFSFNGVTNDSLFLIKKDLAYFERNNLDGFDAIVRCSYGQEVIPLSKRGTSPTASDPFTLSMKLCEVEEPCRYDLDGGRICNSAGDWFYDPVTRRRNDVEYTISRKEYVNPMGKALAYSNTINGVGIWGWNAGTLRLSIEHSIESSQIGWTVTYTIRSNGLGWNPQALDQGFRRLFRGKSIAIVDEEGAEITSPQNLDGNGQPLPAERSPVYLGPFSLYEEADFSLLNLPDVSVFY